MQVAAKSDIAAPITTISQRQRMWRTFRRNKAAVAGLIMVSIVVLVALLSPVIAPHDPDDQAAQAVEDPINPGGHLGHG